MKNYHIYYCRKPSFTLKEFLTRNDVLHQYTHVHLLNLQAKNLDDVYFKMQGEIWSPNGEARELIRSKDLRHTSMSIGDVIYDPTEDKMHQVDVIGFKEVK